ncbi:hypothetical protein [Alteromonas confluentis]|uniref:Uncharacterized protein n=1 Tax=Alteromonas confluentis TaxID=1656094 RepID=A0A1E7ZG38_9ALTE|nr:hypothetical protein [Alteromonas confluentis]OFC72469.1 hypothetical protein BFC18_02600 [Alteromonas confluentis]
MGLRRVLKINADPLQKRQTFLLNSHLIRAPDVQRAFQHHTQFFELLDDTVFKTFNSWKNCIEETS